VKNGKKKPLQNKFFKILFYLSDEDPPDEDFVDEVDELVDEDDLVPCC
jgi:hypothetical protein